MPGTRRTPIARQHKPPVSERAIWLFMKMQRCRDRDRWWDLHTELRREVGAKLWEWPCIEDPHAGNPEEPGTYNYERWKPDEKARATHLPRSNPPATIRARRRHARCLRRSLVVDMTRVFDAATAIAFRRKLGVRQGYGSATGCLRRKGRVS